MSFMYFCLLCLFTFKNLIMTYSAQGRVADAQTTQGEIQVPLKSVGTLPLKVNSFSKPTDQKTPDLNGSTYLALSICSALDLVGKCFIVPWKFIMRKVEGGGRLIVASSVFDGKVFPSLPPWRKDKDPVRELAK